jgi:hypothetical protein
MRRMPPAMDAQGKIDLEVAGDGFFPELEPDAASSSSLRRFAVDHRGSAGAPSRRSSARLTAPQPRRAGEGGARPPHRDALHERVLGWNASVPACAWTSIRCDAANATVVELHLPGVSLVGGVPRGTPCGLLGLLSQLPFVSPSLTSSPAQHRPPDSSSVPPSSSACGGACLHPQRRGGRPPPARRLAGSRGEARRNERGGGRRVGGGVIRRGEADVWVPPESS